MASESTEEGTLTVDLPGELDDWLTDRTATLGVDRKTVLLQLLSSYRAAAELDDDVPVAGPDAIETAVESVLADRLPDATDAVRQQVGDRVDAVEAKHQEDIEDVRGRVVQLKRELDGKAPAGHDHEEFDHLEEIATRLSEVESTVEAVQTEVETTVEEHGVRVDDLEERLEDIQERMKTVAWVVSDLREAHESQGGVEAVDRIKRAAAKADVERAKCESCGQSVTVSLLTDPEYPHCQATVTNVEAAESWFGKPRLLTAAQLESGDAE